MNHLWCPRCDVIVEAESCSCGTQAEKVTYGVDMTELLITAQALVGLVTIPDDFDGSKWDLATIQADLDRRDELAALAQALAEAIA